MGGEVAEVHPPRMGQVLEGLHVPLLGPAYVGGGIVQAFLFILRIVAARSVGAGHADLQLLPVEIRIAVESRGHGADDDDAPLLAGDATREVDGVEAGRGGRDDDRVHAQPVRQAVEMLGQPRAVSLPRAVRCVRASRRHGRSIDIHAEGPDAGRAQHQPGQLPEQPQPDHATALAQAQVGLTDAL